MKRGLVLVEGPTEERFVKDVLQPHFHGLNLHLEPKILVTKVVKSGPSFTGGVSNFGNFRRDIRLLLQGAGGALVTTMLDYYGLPQDFPGMSDRPAGSAADKVRHVERSIRAAFNDPGNFHPFLALHEFEAFLFSSPSTLATVVTMPSLTPHFESIRGGFATPEDINDRPNLAPSKRILAAYPGYRKVLHGPAVVASIGLVAVRAECPHFDETMTFYENWASRP